MVICEMVWWSDTWVSSGYTCFLPHNEPLQHCPVIISSRHRFGLEEESVSTERVIQPMQWGLVPSWHKGSPKKVSYETNNCRSESMMERPTYKTPLQKGRRCVVLADGFFEWKRDQAKKQPYFIYFPDKLTTEGGNCNTTKVKTENVENGTVVKQEEDTTADVKEVKVKVKQEVRDEDQSQIELSNENVGVKQEVKSETKGCTERGAQEGETKGCTERGTQEGETKGCTERGAQEGETKGCTERGTQEEGDGGTKKRLLTMAGVFDVWKPSSDSQPVLSYSIITVESSPAMTKVHHRMPALLLSDKEIQEWLDYENVPLEKAIKHIRATEEIQMHPVSDVVNNARNETPDCTKPIDLTKPKSTPSSNLMMKWLSKGKKETSIEPPAKRIKTEVE